MLLDIKTSIKTIFNLEKPSSVAASAVQVAITPALILLHTKAEYMCFVFLNYVLRRLHAQVREVRRYSIFILFYFLLSSVPCPALACQPHDLAYTGRGITWAQQIRTYLISVQLIQILLVEICLKFRQIDRQIGWIYSSSV